ncbi:MAG: thermonuclease family protein [Emcibacter sp.]|nr:thermonuclease family protein [Emcibacter sp.]
MPKITASFFVFFLFLWPCYAEQEDIREQLIKSIHEEVITVVDGDTVILKDQTRVRLVGIQAPKLPLGRKNFIKWPLSDQSKDSLSDLVLHKFVTLYFGGQKQDRYGRSLAHLFLDNGLWVQGEMLKQGMARVYSFPDNRAALPEMLAYEKKARKTKAGIWALDYYQPKDQTTAERYNNSFQIITGTVKDIAKVRSTIYLNFGDNWRDDFTIVIKSKAAHEFAKATMAIDNLEGKKIEARGWLKSYNGPMIEVTHPEQITIIE